jgi:hypothetical protein
MIYNIFNYPGFLPYNEEREYVRRIEKAKTDDELEHILREMKEKSNAYITDIEQVKMDLKLNKLLEPLIENTKKSSRRS